METNDDNENIHEVSVSSLSYERQVHIIAGFNNIIYKKDESQFKKVTFGLCLIT